MVKHINQCQAFSLMRTNQFQVADAEPVQPKVPVLLYPANGRDMLQVTVFGLVQVMQRHTGGYNAQVQLINTKTFKRFYPEVL
jgi:hypothetical protein